MKRKGGSIASQPMIEFPLIVVEDCQYNFVGEGGNGHHFAPIFFLLQQLNLVDSPAFQEVLPHVAESSETDDLLVVEDEYLEAKMTIYSLPQLNKPAIWIFDRVGSQGDMLVVKEGD